MAHVDQRAEQGRGGLMRVHRVLQALTPVAVQNLSAPLKYAIAAGAVLLCALVQYSLLREPSVAPFVFFFCGVALASWLAGRGPGLLSVVFSAAAANYLFIKPYMGWSLSRHALIPTALFTVSSAAVALLCAAFRDALLDAQSTAAVLRRQSDLLRLSHDAIFVWRLDGGIETWNKGAEELYGFSEQQALGRVVGDLLHTQFPCPWPEIEGALRERQRWDGELVHRTKEGRTVTVSAKLQLVRSAGGVERVLETGRDITGSKRAQQERAMTVEFLRLMNESRGSAGLVRAAVAFIQKQSGCDAVGIRLREGDDYPYFETQGFPREFVLTENQLCTHDDAGELRRDSNGNPLLECMCGNVICGRFNPAKPFFTPRGSFWTNSTTELRSSTPEADPQACMRNRCNREGYESVALIVLRVGEERLGLVQLNDRRRGRFGLEEIALWETLADYMAVALAKHRAEEALRHSEERMKRAQEISHLGSWELDLLNNRLSWSDEVYRIFGLQPQEFGATYEAFLETVHPDDRAAVDAAYSSTKREGRDTYEITHRVLRKPNDEVRIVHEKCEHIRDKSGRIVRSVGMVHDITERKLAEDALTEADRRKDEFLALLAHELRNPLAPIRNSLQLIKMRADDPPTLEASGIAERQIKHLVRLVDDLLDVSRITRGKLELRKEQVELKTVIRSALDTGQWQIQGAGHRLTVRVPEEPIYLQADAVRLVQAVANLLINAAKYTPEGGSIELRAGREGGAVVITVRDDGMGIPRDRLADIFDMFTQVDPSITRAQGGLGIGLFLVKSLVQLHGGQVTAYSAGIDQGSTFTIHLPISRQEPKEERAKAKAMGDSPTSARRVLVVDDNADAAQSTAMLLTVRGHEVRTATSGAVALEIARLFRPEVALLDLGMPSMDGYEVARRLRSEPALRDALLVALTGWGQEEDRQRSREAGFDYHLVKPVDPEQLQALLTKLGKDIDRA